MNFIGKSLYLLLLAMMSVSASAVSAAVPISVKAQLDSASLLMGNVAPLRIEVEQPANAKVTLPILKEGNGAFIPLIKDSVEIRQRFKIDTVKLSSGRIRVNYNLLVQAYDSGYYKLPPFVFDYNGIHVESNRVSLNVIPVKVKADDEIAGFTDVAEPEDATLKGPKSAFRSFLEKYWWLMAFALLALAATLWFTLKAWRNYKSTGSVLPPKPAIPPYDEAMNSLVKLNKRKLWENGREKEFYTGLTFILRRYLYKEYNISAMEMTSAQILNAFKSHPDLTSMTDEVRKILNMADFAKFAKVRPLAEDNEECMKYTEQIIHTAHSRYLRHLEEANRADKANKAGSEGGGDTL
ncbi:MAG: hypothetical protein NC328_02965 [Muribaculum sp.]|nr:hypothetical protein [Muribaculum sp.]